VIENNKPQILWAYQTKVSDEYSVKYYNGEVTPNSLWPNHSVFLDDLKYFYFKPVLIHYLDAVEQPNPFVFAVSLRHFIGGHTVNTQRILEQLSGFDWIPAEVLQACRTNQCTLYFEDPFEGYPDWDGSQVYYLDALAERLNIPGNSIILSTGNAKLPERAKQYDTDITVVYEDYFRFEFYSRKNKSAKPHYNHSQEQKTHIFLNYNRHWNHNRQYFVYSLWSNDLLKHGLVSLSEPDRDQRIQIKNPMYWDEWFSTTKEMAAAAEQADTFMSKLPLLIDVDLKENMAHLLNEDHYLQTYISVISETWGFNSTAFFSEKTYKAILAEHPFIVLSGQGFLHYLRQQGFKTFNGIIDESYDLEPDICVRKDLILKEIHKIANKSKDQLQEFLRATKEITAFNRKMLETDSNYGKNVYESWFNKYKFNGDYTMECNLKLGEQIDKGVVYKFNADGLHQSHTVESIVENKRVVIFGGPAPFSRLDTEQATAFAKLSNELKKHVDEIYGIYCQDAFVMRKFAEEINKEVEGNALTFFADGDAFFARNNRLEFDFTYQGLSVRCMRYVMVVKNKTLEYFAVDDYQLIEKTAPEAILEWLSKQD
jgi:peroxiredoxin